MSSKKSKLTLAGQTVMDQLSGLSKDDLTAVIQRSTTLLKALGGNPHTDQDVMVLQDDWMLDGLYEQFTRTGRRMQLLPRSELPTLPAFKHYMKFAPGIRSGIEAVMGLLSPPQKIAMSRFLAETYLEYLSDRKTPITLSTVLWRIESYVAAIDHEFPGYREAGLLRLLVTTEPMGA